MVRDGPWEIVVAIQGGASVCGGSVRLCQIDED